MHGAGIRLAASPTSWGVDFADSPLNPPWQRVLDDISQSGIGALELGPVGYLPDQPDELRAELDTRNLTAVGSFVFEDLHDPAKRKHVVDVARRTCAVISGAGGKVLVIIDRPARARAATAGRSEDAQQLNGHRWHSMMSTIAEVATIARGHGLTPAVHPHAGSYIEFTDEIDAVLQDTDVGLCLDTGHLAYSRAEPDTAIRDYKDRLVHVHLKDLDPWVLRRSHRKLLDFWESVNSRIFCPLGQGVIDLERVLATLASIGYDGYATIEQDRTPGVGTPLDDLRASIDALTAAGLEDASAIQR